MSERSGDAKQGLSKWAIGGLAAAAVVGVGLLVYKMMGSKPEKKEEKVQTEEKKKKKKKEKKAEKKADDQVVLPLSLETAKALLSDMIDEMSMIISLLSQQINQMSQQGQSEEAINEFFRTKYLMMVTQAHNRILKKHNTTEAAADVAAKLYADDPEFKQLLAKIERMSNTISGQGPSQAEIDSVPAWLDMNKVIEIFREIMQTVTNSIIESMQAVYSETEPPAADATQAEKETAFQALEQKVHARYKATIDEKKNKVFSDNQIDEHVLDVALAKYSQNPALSAEIQKMQMNQRTQVEAARENIRGQSGWGDVRVSQKQQ
jgi:hypothetical protein